jgi:hypothetical protein
MNKKFHKIEPELANIANASVLGEVECCDAWRPSSPWLTLGREPDAPAGRLLAY